MIGQMIYNPNVGITGIILAVVPKGQFLDYKVYWSSGQISLVDSYHINYCIERFRRLTTGEEMW